MGRLLVFSAVAMADIVHHNLICEPKQRMIQHRGVLRMSVT